MSILTLELSIVAFVKSGCYVYGNYTFVELFGVGIPFNLPYPAVFSCSFMYNDPRLFLPGKYDGKSFLGPEKL